MKSFLILLATLVSTVSFAKVQIGNIETADGKPLYLLNVDAVKFCSNIGARLPTAREFIEERIEKVGGKVIETKFGSCDLFMCREDLSKESLSVNALAVDTPKSYPGYVYKDLFRDFYYKVEPSVPDFNEYGKTYWTSSLSNKGRSLGQGLVEYVYPYLFSSFNNNTLFSSDEDFSNRAYVRCAKEVDEEVAN